MDLTQKPRPDFLRHGGINIQADDRAKGPLGKRLPHHLYQIVRVLVILIRLDIRITE